MTIAVGFAYESGLLFCADTKVSTNIKTNESKIEYFVSNNGYCRMAFAVSSADLNFPRNAIEKCWESVCELDFATVSMEEVHRAAEYSLAEFYRDHIYPHPDRTPGTTFLELLVGIWLRGATRLYVSHETVLTPINEYECIGSGAYLAKYLIRQYRIANKDANALEDAQLIASMAVKSAIDYDEYCGGKAEILIIKNDEPSDEMCEASSYPDDVFINGVQKIAWQLLHELAHVEDKIYGKENDGIIEQYFKQIGKMNDELKLSYFRNW